MTASFRFKQLLSRCLPASPRRRRGVRTGWTALQSLEARVLPAGNVQVTISGDQLIIRGDGENNEVSMLVEDGALIVRGLNDTTINGAADDFVVVEDGTTFEGRVIAKLGIGDDTYAIGDDVAINGQLFVEDTYGDDQISIDAASINGGIQIRTHYGDDSIRFNGTTISGATYLYTGYGDDLVVLDNIETSAYFRISTGPGDDGVDTDGNTFGGRFVTRLGFGADDANFDSDSVDENWVVRSRQGDDAVRATNMVVEGSTLFRSTGGDDNYLLTGTNELTGRVIGIFGSGTDNLEISEETETSGGITEKGVEGDETTDSVFTSRFDTESTGLTARADALRASIDGELTLTVDNPADTTESNGVLLTSLQELTVTGTTTADAVVTLDVDNDGEFDDGTVSANNDGTFSIDATLLSDSESSGVQTLTIRSTFGGSSVDQTIEVDVVVGTVVRFTTSLGSFDVELLNADAPETVANFLNYLERYADSIIHRSEKTDDDQSFIIQGGGFVNPPDVSPVATDAPIANEFDADNSNVRGTLSMALPSDDPDGGTSQWFINTGDNSSLDSGEYTVFGKVLGDGMDVVDAIHALTSYNLVGPTGETALANVPLQNYTKFTETLDGTASVTSGSTTVTGVGTSFLTDLVVGEEVQIGTVTGVVASITDDTTFTLAVAADATVENTAVNKNALPAEDSYVTFSSIATLTV